MNRVTSRHQQDLDLFSKKSWFIEDSLRCTRIISFKIISPLHRLLHYQLLSIFFASGCRIIQIQKSSCNVSVVHVEARTNDLLEKLQFTIYGNDANTKKQENRLTTASNNSKQTSRPISNFIPKRFEPKRPPTMAAPMSAKLKANTSMHGKRTTPLEKAAETIRGAIKSNTMDDGEIPGGNDVCADDVEKAPASVSNEMNDLKREVSNLKEIVASLMINSNGKSFDGENGKTSNCESKNDVTCPRCNFQFNVSSSMQLDEKIDPVHCPNRPNNAKKLLSDEDLTNGDDGAMSIIESQFRMTVFDRKSRDNLQNDRRQCDDDDFLREMIGVAEVWGRDRKINKENEDCYEQLRIMRRVSNTNKESKSRKIQSQMEALLCAADQNPNLKKKLETLAMHYLPDSQLMKTTNTTLAPNRNSYERKMLDYQRNPRQNSSDTTKNRLYRLKDKNPEQNDEELFSLCSQKYLRRHGLLPGSALPAYDISVDDNGFDRNGRQSCNVLSERNDSEYTSDYRDAKFIEVDDDDDFLTIPRY